MSSPIPAPPADASSTKRGLVNTIAQTFAGAKTFTSSIAVPDLSLGGLLVLTKSATSNRLKLSHGIEFPGGGVQDVPGITGILTAMGSDANTAALWHFDEAVQNSDAVDSSSNSRALTVTGGGPVVVDGLLGKTRQFRSGTGRAYKMTVDAPLLDAFKQGAYSLEWWITPAGSATIGNLFNVNGLNFSFNDADTILVNIAITAAREIYWTQFSQRTTSTGTALVPLATDVRSHVAITRSARDASGNHRFRIYVNGTLQVETLNVPGLNSSALGAVGSTPQYLGFGCYIDNAGGSSSVVNADIEDMRVSTVERTAAEIQSSFDLGKAANDPFLRKTGGALTGNLTVATSGHAGVVLSAANGSNSFIDFFEAGVKKSSIYWDGGADVLNINGEVVNTVINRYGGNVGIGLDVGLGQTIDEKLDVNGNVKVRGSVKFADGTSFSTAPTGGGPWLLSGTVLSAQWGGVNGPVRIFPSNATTTGANRVFDFYPNSDINNSPDFSVGIIGTLGWLGGLTGAHIVSTKNGTGTTQDIYIAAHDGTYTGTGGISANDVSITVQANTKRVGIGETSPQSQYHQSAPQHVDQRFQTKYTGAGQAYFTQLWTNAANNTTGQIISILRDTANNAAGSFLFDYHTDAATGGGGNAYFAIRKKVNSDADSVFTINSSGNVGIGDFLTSPGPSAISAKLHVKGNVLATAGVAAGDHITTTASGKGFRCFPEDSKTTKFSTFYASDADQWGMGQLYNELWFSAININAARRIGFYLSTPDTGIGTFATNADMYLKTTGLEVRNGITAGGVIQSTSGGIKFPDNSVQTTAAGASIKPDSILNLVVPSGMTPPGAGDPRVLSRFVVTRTVKLDHIDYGRVIDGAGAGVLRLGVRDAFNQLVAKYEFNASAPSDIYGGSVSGWVAGSAPVFTYAPGSDFTLYIQLELVGGAVTSVPFMNFCLHLVDV